MALTVTTSYPESGLALATWTGLANGNTGDSISCARWSDKTVQVGGTFGAGGSVTMQGSNDGTSWATLHNAQGNAVTLTGAGVELIAENTRYVRPNVTAGDGTTAMNITILGSDR